MSPLGLRSLRSLILVVVQLRKHVVNLFKIDLIRSIYTGWQSDLELGKTGSD